MCDDNRLWYEGYRRNSMDSDDISSCFSGSINKKNPMVVSSIWLSDEMPWFLRFDRYQLHW